MKLVFYLEEYSRSYSLRVDRFLDAEDFKLINDDLKSIYIFYDKELKGWKIPKKNALESVLFITRKFGWDVDLGSIVVQEPTIELETKFLRRGKSPVFEPDVLRVNLFKYQLEDVNWGLQRNRFFIASDPGVGKTIESIAIFSQLAKQNLIDSLFILVKNNLPFHWEREIVEYSNVFSEEDICILTNKNKKYFFEEKRPRIVICPNHLLTDVLDCYSNFNLKKLWKKESIGLIVDESHEFKNLKAQRTKALFKIIDSFSYRGLLTATPAINGFEDWYHQMKLLDNGSISYSEKLFKLDIAKKIGTKYDQWGIREYNTDRVEFYLNSFKPWVVKRLKVDLPEMKTKQFVKPVWLEMSQKHINLYNMIKKLYLEKYKEVDGKQTLHEIENKYPYLIMCLENPLMLLDKILDDDKALFKPVETALKNWKLDDHNKVSYLDEFLLEKVKHQKEKVIVFDNHPKTLDLLHARYPEYRPSLIHGAAKLSQLERQKIVDRFNDKYDETKVIFLNPKTGGTGINLNKACKYTVFYSTPDDGTLYRQALDRTYRISSIWDSFVYILTFGKTLDEKIMKRNLAKADLNDFSFKNDINKEYLLSQI